MSGASSTFTGLGLSESTEVKYSPLTIAVVGTTVTPVDPDTLISESAIPLLTATAASSNTASWTPGLKVEMPAFALAGAYSGIVTTSIL